MKLHARITRTLVAAAIVFAPVIAAAQSALATTDATAFLGTWTMTLEGPQGNLGQTVVIKDMSGKVGADLTNDISPTPTPITDITKAGADIVLKFSIDYQGQALDSALTLTPDGDGKAKASLSIMEGLLVMEGAATKK